MMCRARAAGAIMALMFDVDDFIEPLPCSPGRDRAATGRA